MSALGVVVDVVRLDGHTGVAAARNIAARRATTPYVLNLDDDAFLVDADSVGAAALMDADASVAAVAFVQADEHANRRQASQQPAAGDVACYVPSFVGFLYAAPRSPARGRRVSRRVHHPRRARAVPSLARSGWRVVYLPDAPIAHVADSANRDVRTYIRHVIRNDCLNALCSEPAPRAMVSIRSGC